LQVKCGVAIHLNNLFDKGFFGGEGMIIQKGLGVKIKLDQRISPIDRDAVHHHGLHNFLGCIAWITAVFKGQVEFIVLDKSLFIGNPEADVVAIFASGSDGFVLRKQVIKPIAHLSTRIGDNKAAKLPLQQWGIVHFRFHKTPGRVAIYIKRQAIMSGIGIVVGSEGKIALGEIHTPVFARVKNADASVV